MPGGKTNKKGAPIGAPGMERLVSIIF